MSVLYRHPIVFIAVRIKGVFLVRDVHAMNRSRRRWLIWLVPVVFVVVGATILVAGRGVKYVRCTESTTGQFVYYRERWVFDNITGDHTAYIPVVRYCVDGVWYEGEPLLGDSVGKKSAGDSVEIKYNPQLPHEFCIAEADEGELLLFAGAIVIIAAYVVLTTVRDKRKQSR